MDRAEVRRGNSRRFALWANYALLIYTAVALAVLLGVANLIIFDHNVRWDLTPGKSFSLSRFDKRVLSGLRHNVRVMAFVTTADPSYLRLADLLSRIAAFAPRVSYRIVDMNKYPGLARRYGVSTYGEVIVQSQGRRRDFDSSRSDLLIPAILEVSHVARKICFTTGHGEGNLFGIGRDFGYSKFASLLRRDNYQIDKVSLLAGGVPKDASLLVSLAPRDNFLPRELNAIARYLSRGGKFLVFLNPHDSPNLTAFLKKYWLDFTRRVVVDPAFRTAQGGFLTVQMPIYSRTSAITRSMPGPAVFSMARGVAITGKPGFKAPRGLILFRGKSLLESSRRSWASGDPDVVTSGVTRFEPGRDIKGPIPVGSEVDFAVNGDVHAPIARMARIVGFGNSAFVSNQFIGMPGNRILAMNAVNELANYGIAIAGREHPGTTQSVAFYVTNAQADGLFYLGAIAVPSLMFLVAVAVFVRRRFYA